MRMQRIRISMMASVALVSLGLAAGCGGADGDEPTVSGIAVECIDADDANVGQVVSTVSADVSDPDRDLVGVEGRVNGVQLTLTDDDADERFTWSPPESSVPLACAGDFFIQITAADKAGNTTTRSTVINK